LPPHYKFMKPGRVLSRPIRS